MARTQTATSHFNEAIRLDSFNFEHRGVLIHLKNVDLSNKCSISSLLLLYGLVHLHVLPDTDQSNLFDQW